MFYFLSKVFTFLLEPFNWILILGITYFFAKRYPKLRFGCKWVAVAILLVTTNPYLHNRAILAWEVKRPVTVAKQTYEAGIVLGGMAMFDKKEQGYFGYTADRFIQIVKMYHSGIIKKVVITGGSNSFLLKEPAESDFVYQEMLACGVKKEDIIKENQSRNTHQNAIFSKRILDSLHIAPPYLLISSATHLRRASRVFEKAQMPVVLYPAAFEAVDKKMLLSDYCVPDASLLFKWGSVIKEVVGLWVYQLTGKA